MADIKVSSVYEERVKTLLEREWGMLIGGEVVAARGGETIETTSPADGRFLAKVPFAQREDVNQAVAAAKEAFPAWRKTPLVEKAARMRAFVRVLREHAEELGILDAIDCGNPAKAMIGDVGMACGGLEYISGVAMEVKGQTLPSMGENWLLTRREPYGVVGRIVPFNHPILFMAWKIGAPVMTGNTLVLKGPEQAPLSSMYLSEIMKDVFPPGVVNIICGDGPTTGDALVRHPEVKRIALVGSVETGQRIQASAAEVGVKHVSLELGGKNPMIVFPDADLDEAVEAAAFGMNFHWCQGQSCGSTSRLFLHEEIHDEFLEKLIERVKKIRIGHPLDPETQMGCLVSKEHYEKVMGYVELGKKEGARLVHGGGKPEGEGFEDGYFLAPTIFDDVTMEMRLANEEIFGPVLSVLRWSDREKVIQEANAVEYGLTGAVWTTDIRTAFEVADALDTGYVWINGSGSHFLGAPFSGHKNSGTDSEEGIEELLSYTQSKTVSIGLGAVKAKEPSRGGQA
ncbi:aldehyde dehydrogenase family protein [Rubrobacter marinus]|nr:aldehyde dehydrogenase family protein [Rubrobacter marinus]